MRCRKDREGEDGGYGRQEWAREATLHRGQQYVYTPRPHEGLQTVVTELERRRADEADDAPEERFVAGEI